MSYKCPTLEWNAVAVYPRISYPVASFANEHMEAGAECCRIRKRKVNTIQECVAEMNRMIVATLSNEG